jgi:hypothetical protein
LTSGHDVFTAGLNQAGQLGIGDEDSKTSFTWVKLLAGKNITSIYAGGHHTWFVIDSDNKHIPDYTPPSPLRTSLLNSPLNLTQTKMPGRGDHSDEHSIIKDKNRKNDFGLEHLSLHVIFSDQGKSHRFARVTLDEREMTVFNRTFAEYIKIIEDEEGGLAFYNIQKDDDLFQLVG